MDFKPTLTFFENLQKKNNKDWFDANRSDYEKVKSNWLDFVKGVITEVGKFEPAVLSLEPKDCVYRINRDVRFSKDKTPYKTNISAVISPGGKKSSSAGYYMQISPGGKSMVAGGMWQPENDKLHMIRQEIEYHPDKFKEIVENKSFISTFGKLDDEDMLASTPKGFDKNSPMSTYLRHKSYLVFKEFSDEDVLKGVFEKEVVKLFHAMLPLNQFLNRATEQI
ncbi:MAG: DUF2461 domain-containing protein [Bacteroidota bacterium]|nr:DUF2461 domain-containing protein [Bacteroidota bacterium]